MKFNVTNQKCDVNITFQSTEFFEIQNLSE